MENLEKLQNKLEKDGYSIDGTKQLGAALGSHVGPGCFGIVFVEKE
jgi:fatty acid-binding protein DegV